MNPFPQEPTFVPGEVGFDDKDADGRPYDLLGRKPLGRRLTDLLDSVEQPLVIALDGGWGSGKSHFLKLWTGAHAKELGGKAKVIYFDAFEHDYLDDPLISLVSRLTMKQAEKTFSAKAVNAIKKAAIPLTRLVLRAGAAATTAGMSEIVGPVADAAIEKVSDASQATIDSFWKQQTSRIVAMKQFRDALTALTKTENGGEKPQKIVFIVDELDRCRPDYALTLLEIVKHFFAVPNVHFVLGTNLAELENSVRTRYGAATRATEYLTKFIHLRMNFPQVRNREGNGDWSKYLDEVSAKMGLVTETIVDLKSTLSIYGRVFEISLRDIQRIASRLTLFPKAFSNYHYGLRRLATSALIMETLAPTYFTRLRAGTLEINQVLQLFPELPNDRIVAATSQELHHLWRRTLMENPGDETLKITEKMFGFMHRSLDKEEYAQMWVELFDSFQLVSDSNKR